MRVFLMVFFASAALASFAADEHAHGTADLLAEARPAIEAANADWVPAMKRKDAKAIASAYAVDGVLVAPSGKAIQGRDAVEKFYGERMQAGFRFVSGGIAQDGVVLVAGPMIYEWGHAEIEIERDGKVVHSAGKYLTVWKRTPDGLWQISRNLAM